jgi:hypothetical protein
LAGLLEVQAGDGSVEIDGVIVDALRSATFDHQTGKIEFKGTQVSAPYIKTGGSGAGKTTISNSELATKGTSVKVTGAANKITMTGNASMKQT